MQSSDLAEQQLIALRRALRPKLLYIRRLKNRMIANDFPKGDRMLRDVLIAEAALNDLVAEIEDKMSYNNRNSDDMDPRKIF